MKTFRFLFGALFSLAWLVIIMLIDIDTIQVVENFGGIPAYFEKNPFAFSALLFIATLNVFFAVLVFAGYLIARDKL